MSDDVLARVRARVQSGKTNDMGFALTPPSTPSEAELAALEARLGAKLPPLLREVLLACGDGIGPGYGLLGLNVTPNGFDPTLLSRKLLPIVDWGCAIFSVVDCGAPDAPVYVLRADGSGHVVDSPATSWTLTDASGALLAEHKGTPAAPGPPPDSRLVLHKPSLAAWLTAWADGASLWDEMESLG